MNAESLKPPRHPLQFSLAGLLFFVLFAGSVAGVVVRWNPWVIVQEESHGATLPGGKYLIEPVGGNAILVDATTGKTVQTIPGSFEALYPDDGKSRFMIVQADGAVQIWNGASGERVLTFTHRAKPFEWNANPVSPDGNHVALLGLDDKLRVWRTVDEALLATLDEPGKIKSAFFAPDGKRLLIRGDQPWYMWDLDQKRCVKLNAPETDYAYFSPDSKRLWIGGHGIFSTDTGARILELQPACYAGGFSPDGKRIWGSNPNELCFWDAATGSRLHAMNVTGGVEFSPDCRMFLTTRVGDCVRIWDGVTYEQLGSFHMPAIFDAVFDADGHRIVTTTSDDKKVVWAQRFPAHRGGHLMRPEVWLAVAFGMLWFWRVWGWLKPRHGRTQGTPVPSSPLKNTVEE
ncbi:MAG: WD40 repeat domain-containing protein [Planctomycetota bacterium]|nr:WD40 repeat domain-containing protein [Planctomycetota bacterium]